MVNLSSRQLNLAINGFNYTSHLLEARLNDSPWDETGEIATMLEGQIWGPLDEVDPLVNADLKHGAEVILKIANDAGSIPVARDRTLYIIRLAFNEETHVCSFTACDKLTWNNWDEELDDQEIEDILVAQNAFDVGIQHAELARLFLQEKGLSASISGTFPDYRINYLVSPDTWVSGARGIVASALGYIWVAPSGAIEIRPINTAAAPAFHLSLSQCDSDRASQEVTPAEKIIAVCSQPITSRNDSGAGVGNTWSETGNTSSQTPDDPDPPDVETEENPPPTGCDGISVGITSVQQSWAWEVTQTIDGSPSTSSGNIGTGTTVVLYLCDYLNGTGEAYCTFSAAFSDPPGETQTVTIQGTPSGTVTAYEITIFDLANPGTSVIAYTYP